MAANFLRNLSNSEVPLPAIILAKHNSMQPAVTGSSSPINHPVLTHGASPTKMQDMAHSFLIFDFGGNEDAAQQARHRIDGWKQGFRLDKKLQVKFERKEPEGALGEKLKAEDESSSKANSAVAEPTQIRLIVRLDFSDHEKLSHQRWIERIPVEEPFKGANPQIIRAGEPAFKAISDLFDSLD
jgi:hypothetical protein